MDYIIKLLILVHMCAMFTVEIVTSGGCSSVINESKAPTFMDCQYRCHCKEDSQCDENTGECSNGCESGWMGPGCQYRNIAEDSIKSKQYGISNVKSDASKRAIDGQENTCSRTNITTGPGQQYYTIKFNKTYEVLGLIIKVPPEDVENFRNFRIETGVEQSFPSLCYLHANTTINTTMEIMCDRPTQLKQLRIKLDIPDVPLRLCELEIYGGRSVTFNKHSNQITTYHSPQHNLWWNSSRAVDGKIPTTHGDQNADKTCSATNYSVNPWWRVDLGTPYILHEVHFYGRLDNTRQFQHFHLKYGQSISSFTDYYHDKNTNKTYWQYYQPLIIPINPFVTGQFLQIQFINITQKEPNVALLAICEVIAFAECPKYKCGWNCSEACHCLTEITGSHKIDGTCPHGCVERWTGDDGKCDHECEPSQWGTKCENTCGHCKGTCDVITGRCSEGCTGPWMPPLCSEECTNSTYGINCTQKCGMCRNSDPCNTTDGSCAEGCQAGWKTPTCDELCPGGFYGMNCSDSCGFCKNISDCDHVNGHCPNGCQSGYKDEKCDLTCDSGTYGPGCSLKCGQCKNGEKCHFKSGICQGCKPGFQTVYCNMTCDDGYFGLECVSQCGFCNQNKPCDKITGDCKNGCQKGWTDKNCSRNCDNHTYGVDCKQSCGYCSDSDPCHPVTGVCSSCQSGYTGDLCTEESSMSVVKIVLVCILVIMVVVLIIIGVMVKKLRRPGSYCEEMTTPLKKAGDMPNTVAPPACEQTRKEPNNGTQEDNVYGNTVIDSDDILVARLRMVSNTARDNPEPFIADYKELKKVYASIDKRKTNKNKYSDILPYKFNRVILPRIDGIPDSEYINASYINGFSQENKYIAAQGAIKTTVHDIWRMVWSHNVTTIVMLTKCYEDKLKCEMYWPDDHSSKTYSTINVEWVSSDNFIDFCVRTFNMTKPDTGEQRTLVQFHYTAWPDKNVPKAALSLVQFWHRVRANSAARHFPWVVHCSAGIGRTGTFIALDFLYDQGYAGGVVNVKGAVNTLRQQRMNMVQTQEQYILLHEALADVLDPIGNMYHVDEFVKQMSSLEISTLQKEYQAICDSYQVQAKPTEENVYYNVEGSELPEARKPINLQKSRYPDIYPDDLDRPLLCRIPVEGHNEFINAVFVSTIRQHDKLILTQVPLENTTVDFVRMIWDTNISTIVLLEPAIDEKCCYWPLTTSTTNIGPIQCELLEEKQYEHYIIRTLKYITDVHYVEEKEKVVRQFHFLSWLPEWSTPESTQCILALVAGIERSVCDNIDSQIVFQCLDGATRSGLLCVLWSALERIKTDREFSIADIVRLCRVKRRQIIYDFEQYAFCYHALKDYLDGELYSNVF